MTKTQEGLEQPVKKSLERENKKKRNKLDSQDNSGPE